MLKKTLKMKMKYMKKYSDGTIYMDAQGFQSLKEEETILCYNKEEPKCTQLEFFCCICNRSLKGLRPCESHWTNSKHKKQLHGHTSKIKHCKNLRRLCAADDSELSLILRKTAEERLMTESNHVDRRNVCKDVEETIKASGVYDISCHLYGSSLTRVGFSDANVNIDIQYDIEKISKIMTHITDAPLFLFHICSTIKNSGKFCDVVDLFHVNTPKFTFTHVESGLSCIVCPHFKPGVRTSLLIMDYMCMDERVKILCIAFRHWAMICGVDDTAGGSLSPYCFTIMMIHYLQQVDPPVVPVINLHNHEYLPTDACKRSKNMINTDQVGSWESKNKLSVGKLWVGFFKYYLIDFFFKTLVVNITQHSPMTKQLRGLNSRRISIEDPFFQKDNVAGTLTSSAVMEYFISCLEKSYRYYSLCAPIERGEKKIEASPDNATKNNERKKLREERRSGESSVNKKAISRKEKKENDELSSDQDDALRKGKGREHSKRETKAARKNDEALKPNATSTKGTVNDIKSDNSKNKNVVSDVVHQQAVKKIQFPDSDSENEDTNSQSEDRNDDIEFRDSQEDFDSHDGGDSQDENGDSCDGDDDLPNENENSDVEIEEEYFENKHGDLQKVGGNIQVLRNNQDNCEVSSNNEQPISKPDMVSMESDLMNVKHGKTDDDLQPNDESVQSEIHLVGLSNFNRDYDSQYDGDVDSQFEDDSKTKKVDGCQNESNVFSDTGTETDEVIQVSCELVYLEYAEVKQSQNDFRGTTSGTVMLNSAPDILDNDLSKTAENLIPNTEKLSIDDPISEISEPIKGGEEEESIEHLIEDASIDESDTQVHISTSETMMVAENRDVTDESTRQDNSLHVTHVIKEISDGVDKVIVTNDCKKYGDEILKNSDTNKIDDFSEKQPMPSKFCFKRKFLAPVRSIPLFCNICNKDGHRTTECDLMEAGKIVPLQPVTKNLREMLDTICEKILKDNELSNYEKEQRFRILQEMERHLKKYFNETCRLALFGSSVNNFGFRGSDLDICMRFDSDDPPVGLDHPSMVVKIAKALDKHDHFHKVMYIKSAKVPIVKFMIRTLNLEGDISLYNCLALKNSFMLRAYASIDTRVRILGYCVKVFAKICEIGDASRGSLSSYAYTLLTLYYLQRCEPPVIPVLQELYNHSEDKPISLVEGWNTWYFSDIKKLADVWGGYGKNHQSVGELWLGFFRFYVEKFDFARNVVAIKQLKTLSKFQKCWTHATMSIEDPYNLHHNLAAGISRNMFRYIFGCFQSARVHFGSVHTNLRKNSSTEFLLQYFFNRNHLTENKHVPKDRLCHRCGRIGHTAANCAEKIVADRERRRHDSERTFSSENGDSDNNQNTKGKNSMDNVTCYGCQKYGHRVANCPKKVTNKSPGNERHRNDSNRDRKDSYNSDRKNVVVSQAKNNPTGIQAATDFHPMENVNVVLAKSEMTTKFKPEPKRGSKHNTEKRLRVKVNDIERVNSLFTNPIPRKSIDQEEKAKGHQFSTTTIIDELNFLQASVTGVSFLQTTPQSPENNLQSSSSLLSSHSSSISSPNETQRRRVSPLKTSSRVDKVTKSSNRNSEKDLPVFSNQSDFPSLDFSPGKSPSNQKNQQSPIRDTDNKSMWQTQSGYQPVSRAIQGNTPWLSIAPDFKYVGQEAPINRMESPGHQQHQPTNQIIPLMLHPIPHPYTTGHTPGNENVLTMKQTGQRNGAMIYPPQHAQGYHFIQPGISHSPFPQGKPGNKSNLPNQATSSSQFYCRSSSPEKKQGNATTTPPGFSPHLHWTQAPPPPPGYTRVNQDIQGDPQTEHNTSPSSFKFEYFAKEYQIANSPPKATFPKEIQSVNSPEKNSDLSQINLPMKYDEEYPSPQPSCNTPTKKNKKKEKKSKN